MSIAYRKKLDELRSKGKYRQFTPLEQRNGCRVVCDGREMLNLTSNDYLGLAGDPQLHHDFYRGIENNECFLDHLGLGSASSRLLTGDNANAHLLEKTISTAYGSEACLLFNSGYHANIGIMPALFDKGDLILTDKLNHASLVDGMRLSRAHFKRFRHSDYMQLRELLKKYRSQFNRVVIVTESVFSMDGDVADLGILADLKKEFDCMLYVDEAHGTGLYGEKGLGMAEEQGRIADIDLLVGTFGKAIASIGSYLVCSRTMKEYLVNHSRSLIFTTALPPVVVAWNLKMFSMLASFQEKRLHLRRISDDLRQRLRESGLKTAGSTNIVPVMIGDDGLAVAMGAKMREAGYLVLPVRPPTVPEGSARFRLSLTANMAASDLERVAITIQEIFQAKG